MQIQTVLDEMSAVEAARHQRQAQVGLRPTVEITTVTNKRVTGWGWRCSCGDGEDPKVRSRSSVLAEAQWHFDNKHGGAH